MDKLISLIKKAGEIALFEQSNLVVNKKKDNSIVSNGDLKVSSFLEISLKKEFPKFETFSEENTTIPVGNNVIIIDPIDGTESYVRKENSWCILIAFIENKVPSIGLIYQPSTNTMFYAKKGSGAFKIKNDVKTSLQSKKVGDFTGICSFKDCGEISFLNKHKITNIEKSYSASLKIMKIADGTHDLYPNFRKKCSLWDLVAPELILEEAGGFIKYEEPLSYDYENTHVNQNFIASSKRIII